MNLRKHPFVISVVLIGLTLVGLGLAIARHQWFFSFELVDGVRVVQTPFEYTYSIYTPKGRVIEDAFGWIIRPGYLYGACGRISYFMIDLNDFSVTRFNSLIELNVILKAKGLPRYDMNDEENTSHLKYEGGRRRKYR